MNTKRFVLFLTVIALPVVALAADAPRPADETQWQDKNGNLLTREAVVDFLVEHRHLVAEHKVEHPKRKDQQEDYAADIKSYPQLLQGAKMNGVDWVALLAEAGKQGGWPADEQRRLEYLDLSLCLMPGGKLSGLKMQGMNLSGAVLSGAKMEGSELAEADVTGANLTGANLTGVKCKNLTALNASWPKATLGKASFVESHLDNSDFEAVNATGMVLENSTALGASFKDAILTEAKLNASDVDKADFEGATLTNVTWEVRGQPDIPSLVYSKDLSALTYRISPIALVALRKMLMEAGIQDQEREVNYALQRGRTEHLRNSSPDHPVVTVANRIEAQFRVVCFDWPCMYGLHPCRPLKWIIILCLLCTFPYAAILLRAPKLPKQGRRTQESAPPPGAAAEHSLMDAPQAGIWAVPLEKPVESRGEEAVLLHVDLRKKGWLRGIWRAVCLGLFFSVISAFSTGYRDLDVGRWIERIKREESTLRGTGWVRTLSGLQSLASFFLLALWLLTYFGRPFE